MFNFYPPSVAFEIPFSLISPQLANVPIYWYGILIVAGALGGAWIASVLAKQRGLDPDHVWNALLFALLFGVAGARIYHIISDLAQNDPLGYLNDPIAMLNPRTGGLGIYGAVAGGLLGLFLYTRYAKLKFWTWVDLSVPGLLFGQAVGRWGNFFNQELYGWPTDLPWGIPIDQAHRLPQFAALPPETRFHPTFLYESLGLVLCFGISLWVMRRFRDALYPGDMFLLYLVLYPVLRFFTEMQRPDAWKISEIPTAQIIAVAAAVSAAVWLAYRHTGPAPARQTAPARKRARPRSAQYRAAKKAAVRVAPPPASPVEPQAATPPPPEVDESSAETKS